MNDVEGKRFIGYLEGSYQILREKNITSKQSIINTNHFNTKDVKKYIDGFEILLAYWSSTSPDNINEHLMKYFTKLNKSDREPQGLSDLPKLTSQEKKARITSHVKLYKRFTDVYFNALYNEYGWNSIIDKISWPYQWNSNTNSFKFELADCNYQSSTCSHFDREITEIYKTKDNCCVNEIHDDFIGKKCYLDVATKFWNKTAPIGLVIPYDKCITKLDSNNNAICYICGKIINISDDKELDHIVPITTAYIFGLTMFPLNFTDTHGKCNGAATNKPPSSDEIFDFEPLLRLFKEIDPVTEYFNSIPLATLEILLKQRPNEPG